MLEMKRATAKRAGKVKQYGRYIVADQGVCHGALTFRGTRVFVTDVLDQVARGVDWDEISREWHGLPREAIAEAIQLARLALLSQNGKPNRRLVAR